ncbi:hypothetical protein ACFLSQ_07010 [Bacteroidota bacterium]
MKIRLLPFVVAVLMLTSAVNVFSQGGATPLGPEELGSKIYIGPVFGYNSVDHSTNKLATFGTDEVYCPDFTGGTGQGFYVGLTYEHHLGKKIEESTSSIIGRVLFSMYPGDMAVGGDDWPSLVVLNPLNPEGWGVTRSVTQHELDISYSVLAFEVMYKQNIMKEIPLGITLGPTVEIPIQKNIVQEYSIISPENVQFRRIYNQNPDGTPNYNSLKYEYRNSDRTVVPKDGDIENASAVRIGLKFGLQYEIIIGEGYYIVPSVYYNYSIMNVKSDEDYSINVFQAGIDIRFAI